MRSFVGGVGGLRLVRVDADGPLRCLAVFAAETASNTPFPDAPEAW